jgi:hypothetical protein
VLKFLKRLLTPPLVLLAALWLFFEDWFWDRFTALAARLSLLAPVREVEAWIAGLPPYRAMALFLVPASLMLPFKVVGLWLIAAGHAMMGVATFLVAKVIGTALLTWIYAHCRTALLTVPWFARLHAAWQRFRAWVHARLLELGVWRAAAALALCLRRWLKRARGGMLRRRWLAIRRLRKRRAGHAA